MRIYNFITFGFSRRHPGIKAKRRQHPRRFPCVASQMATYKHHAHVNYLHHRDRYHAIFIAAIIQKRRRGGLIELRRNGAIGKYKAEGLDEEENRVEPAR